jgi:hypothetical protein
MCDYSIHVAKTRNAEVGDELIAVDFGNGTRGFARPTDGKETATCLLPGTEIAFIQTPVRVANGDFHFSTAIFRQRNKHLPMAHHDVLEFPDGQQALLGYLFEGTEVTVLQLPAKPRTKREVEEQRRAEYVG